MSNREAMEDQGQASNPGGKIAGENSEHTLGRDELNDHVNPDHQEQKKNAILKKQESNMNQASMMSQEDVEFESDIENELEDYQNQKGVTQAIAG